MVDISKIADVIEFQTWAAEESRSVGALKEDLEAALSTDDHDSAEEYSVQVFEELGIRARLLGEAYPFLHDGMTLAPNESKRDASYLFCLGLSLIDSREITLEIRSREFEEVVKAAAEKYFRGKATRIGAPWATKEITDYETLLQKVSDLIPDIGPPTRKNAPSGGDTGWDVVVVNNFSDNKFSRIIALGNCATGRTDWRNKGLEAQPTLFWSFFTRSPVSDNVCITFIAVPFVMTPEDKLRKTGPTCIAFDRVRICENAPSASPSVRSWLEGQRQGVLGLPIL